jgi:hypothetical protein
MEDMELLDSKTLQGLISFMQPTAEQTLAMLTVCGNPGCG